MPPGVLILVLLSMVGPQTKDIREADRGTFITPLLTALVLVRVLLMPATLSALLEVKEDRLVRELPPVQAETHTQLTRMTLVTLLAVALAVSPLKQLL